MSEDGAAERFWLQLQALYRAAGKPTLQQLVRLGQQQDPPAAVGLSTIADWLNGKSIPSGQKNERYLAALVTFLSARARAVAEGVGASTVSPAAGEWQLLLRMAQAERAEGQRGGRPRRSDLGRADLLPPTARAPLRAAGYPDWTLPTQSSAPEPQVPEVAVSHGGFVGRADELAVLSGLVRQVAAGHAGAAFIEGEPGIGKTALVRQALADAPALGCQVFWGTANELDEALPLQPLLDALRVRGAPGAPDDPRRAAIARFLRGETVAERGMDGTALLAEQLLTLAVEECARPVILVLDDLQWADRASLRLLAKLVGATRNLPLLLVTMARPVPHRDETVVLRRAAWNASPLRLSGLGKEDTAALVAALAGGAPDGGLLSLAGDAAGNPLYLTELIGALTRGDRVTVAGDGTAVLNDGPAPDSLAAAIADRLGFIAGPTRDVLATASLLGPEFTVTDLAIVLGTGVGALTAPLHEARAAGILTESGTRLKFRHPLIHQALYAGQPVPVRAALHQEAGRALAQAGVPIGRVARQLVQALGGYIDEDAGGSADGSSGLLLNSAVQGLEDWAVEWLVDAAELLVTQAPAAAARLLGAAVAGLPVSGRRGLLGSHLADALYRIGDREQAKRVANRELAYVTDPDAFVGLHWTLAQCRMLASAPEAGFDTLAHALEAPGLTARHRGRLLVLAARAHVQFGQLEAGSRVAGLALAEAEAARDTWTVGWALHVMAIGSTSQGRSADALPLYDRALTVTETEPTLADLRILLLVNKAAALGNLDRLTESLVVAQEALRLASEAGATLRLTQAHGVLLQVLFETGRWDEAIAELSAMPANLKENIAHGAELGSAALISFYRGDDAAAREYLAVALPYAAAGGRRLIPPVALTLSFDYERSGDLTAALSALTCWFDEGTEELSQTQDILPDAVRLALRVGDLDTARSLTKLASDSAVTWQTPFIQGNALYCRGLLSRSGTLLLEAASHYARAGRPLPRAKALEAAAAAFAQADAHSEAAEALAAATETYATLGVLPSAAIEFPPRVPCEGGHGSSVESAGCSLVV